jgi:hypothetical protein
MTIRFNDLDPHVALDAHDPAPERPAGGALVTWMDPKPMAVGPAGISATAAAAFALGAAAAVSLLALLHWISPRPYRR